METNKIDELLAHTFSKLEDAPPSTSMKARARLAKATEFPASDDIFAMIASFLNLRIKLYHAVIASLVIWAGILFFSEEDQPAQNSSVHIDRLHHLAATNNPTILSSCQTFVLRK